MLLHDNVKQHITTTVTEYNWIEYPPPPPRNPDLNHIEYIWYIIGRQVYCSSRMEAIIQARGDNASY